MSAYIMARLGIYFLFLGVSAALGVSSNFYSLKNFKILYVSQYESVYGKAGALGS